LTGSPLTPIIVSGATSQIGVFLLPRLIEAGFHVHALSRKDTIIQNHSFFTWHQLDITNGWRIMEIPGISQFFHLAPIWLLPDIIEALSCYGIRRIVALSSTSRFTKLDSENHQEREISKKLAAAEKAFIAKCVDHGISWTLFRPTLIYGCEKDKNVTIIAKFISRFGFFPLTGRGEGYRQPVHADDVAKACTAALTCPNTCNRAYNLSGGQMLTFKEMVEAIFLALNKKPRIVNIPEKLAYFLLKGASLFPAYRFLNNEMIKRMDQDLCFDSSDAISDFGYSPRGFQYQPGRNP